MKYQSQGQTWEMDTTQPWSPQGTDDYYLIGVNEAGVVHYAANPGGLLKEGQHPRYQFRDIFTICGIHRLNDEVSGDGLYTPDERAMYSEMWEAEGETRSICQKCQKAAAKHEEEQA